MNRARVACAAFAAAVVAGFAWLRATSTFARVEARAAEASALAVDVGLAPEEVMALLDLSEGALPAPALRELAARVVAARGDVGDLGLAVASAMGHADLVREVRAANSPEAARVSFIARPEGLVVTRFLTMARRYLAARPD